MASHPEPRVVLIRAAQLVASPWKNGGGVTREIAAEPPGASLDTFLWRVSVADVAQPGPFSRFPGIDRTLVLLSGAGMTLVGDDGARQVLAAPLDRFAFAGETPLAAELADGPTRDFNLMTRRGAVTGRVSVYGDGASGDGARFASAATTLLLFCASGAPSVTLDGREPIALGALDTVRVDVDAGRVAGTIRGEGVLLGIELIAKAAMAAG